VLPDLGHLHHSGITPFDSIRFAGRRAMRDAEDRAAIKKLGAHYDTEEVAARNAQLVRAAGFPTLEAFTEGVCDRLSKDWVENKFIPVYEVRQKLVIAAIKLYEAEDLHRPLPQPTGLDDIGEARYRDKLLARIRKQSNPETLPLIHRALLQSELAFSNLLPKMAHEAIYAADDLDDDEPEASASMVPLIDILHDPGKMVHEVILPFFYPDVINADLFFDLRKQLEKNQIQLSPNPMKKLLNPEEYDGPREEMVHAFLRNTPLESIFAAKVPFKMPEPIRFEHSVIFGGAGAGKTQLLSRFLWDDLGTPDPPSVVIIDPHGDFLKEIQRLKLFAPGGPLHRRLVILDPEQFSPALNMFGARNNRLSGYSENVREQVQAATIETFTYIFAGLAQELTGAQSTAFSYVARLMLSIPGATIHDLLDLMEDEPKSIQQSKFAEHIEKMDRTSRSFFENQFFSKSMSQTKNGIARRLYGVLQIPAFNRMFGATQNKLDMFEILQTGNVCLVHTAKNLLKEDASSLFGRYIVAQVLHAAFERVALTQGQRRAAFLLIDEAGEFCDPLFDSLLREVRKFRLGVTLAFQYVDQLPPSVRSSVFSNTAIKFASQVSDKDARVLAPDMRTTHEFIGSMKKRAKSTEFACYVRNYTENALRLEIQFGTLEGAPKMTDDEYKEIIAQCRAQFGADQPASPTKPNAVPDEVLAERTSQVPDRSARNHKELSERAPKRIANPESDDWRS
jgi:Helicase HerA, central domain